MRAGPLSKPEVIKLINAHFVPVYAVNEDYRGDGPKPADERREYTRIYREALDAKMSAGTVHVYIASPDGKAIDSMHVAEASETDKLLATLKRNIARLNVPAGETLVKPKPQSVSPPGMAKDAVALHLVSRALGGGGSWGGVVENWIVLNSDELAEFFPVFPAKVGVDWKIDPEVSAKLLTHFYPSTENNDVSKNVFEHQQIEAKVIAIDPKNSIATVRLDGAMKMKHSFYHRDDDNVASAKVVGYLQIDTTTSSIRAFGLTTVEATYGGGRFAVGVRLASDSSVSSQAVKAEKRPGSLTIGAYYYPWYGAAPSGETGWMSQAMRGRLQPQQLPKLGVYGSRDLKVIGEHIAQSVQAGLDFWAVSWWGPGRRDDRTFREQILSHADAGKLKYAVLYESTGRLGSMRSPDYANLLKDFAFLKEHYFDHPGYLKIDNKPVVFIYLTRVYFRDRGLEPLAELRREFPNLYLVGDEVFGGRYHERHARLWDAITAYDVYGQSMQNDGATRAAVTRLHDHYANAKKLANGVGTGFIPGIAPGYNDRAVRKGHVGRARYFTDQEGSKEGDIFRAMIKDVAIPLADPKVNRTIMVTSFNEWYEDTQIEPTAGTAPTTTKDDSETGTYYTEGDRYVDYGSLYLDILREAKEASAKEKP